MIQVLRRAFEVLEKLNPDEGVGLAALTRDTGVNKGTLCNILKTLVDLGYVSKNGNGRYKISRAFFRLAYPSFRDETIRRLSTRFARRLSDDTRESGVVATLVDDEVRIIAQARYERSLMVNAAVYKNLSLYHSVSGRVLVSFLSDDERNRLLEMTGFPGADWDGIEDDERMRAAVAAVRESGMSVMPNADTEIKAFAVPILDADGAICASLGLTVPSFRLANGTEDEIVNALRSNARRFEDAVAADNLKRPNWLNCAGD